MSLHTRSRILHTNFYTQNVFDCHDTALHLGPNNLIVFLVPTWVASLCTAATVDARPSTREKERTSRAKSTNMHHAELLPTILLHEESGKVKSCHSWTIFEIGRLSIVVDIKPENITGKGFTWCTRQHMIGARLVLTLLGKCSSCSRRFDRDAEEIPMAGCPFPVREGRGARQGITAQRELPSMNCFASPRKELKT